LIKEIIPAAQVVEEMMKEFNAVVEKIAVCKF
jgi:hypothetical protein